MPIFIYSSCISNSHQSTLFQHVYIFIDIEADLCISILNQLLKNVSYKTVTVMLFL